uniref:GOLD domain-containing protein n=1 Tax=Electrophorus electricus TaxID=8005 RepID=A0A4W4GJ05_ELEEL
SSKAVSSHLSWTGFLIASFVISTQAMYFDLVQQKERCIIEEIPEDTLVTGEETHWDKNQQNSQHLGLTITVKDPNYEVLLMKRFGRYGKFTFTSHSSGQHFLCVKSNSTRFSVFAREHLEREETFRQMSEETNGNVLWWAIMQTSILLTVGFYQIRSLKNFLIEKKLV